MWPNARKPDKVLNGLINARESKIFTDFPLKDSFNFFMFFDFRNVERFQILCSFAR